MNQLSQDLKQLNQQQFGDNAEKYATSPGHAQGPSLMCLPGLTRPEKNWVMLDVSTGAGHTALLFAPHVKNVIASDLTLQMLEVAKRLASERGIQNIEFRPADAQALPFEDNTFELVTNRLALHHYPDARTAIAEMGRVCKPGGVVALVDIVTPPDEGAAAFINSFENLRDPSHNWAFSTAQLEAMFMDSRLKVEHSETMRGEGELDLWADRMGASAETKNELRRRLRDAPSGAKEFWSPRVDGARFFFRSTSAIIIGRKF